MKKGAVLLFVFVCLNLGISFAQATKPYQFIAKIYTEALGVVPDPAAWSYNQSAMTTASNLKQWMRDRGIDFFTDSVYFLPKYPITTHKASRLLALYRGCFNREPSFSEFTTSLAQITNDTSWTNLVKQFFNSAECNALFDYAINRANLGKPDYGWGVNRQNGSIHMVINNLVTDYPVVGTLPSTGKTISGTELQVALENARNSTNKIVLLSQMAVIELTDSIIIPNGVTLATVGYPDRTQYAKMARIIWKANTPINNHNMIRIETGGKLLSIWIDGQVGPAPRFPRAEVSTIWVQGDTTYQDVEITDNRISDSYGCRSIWMGGHLSPYVGTKNIKVSSNLFTGYANDHFVNYSDGIDFGAEDADVCYNEFVDITDVAIGIFRSQPNGNNSFEILGSQHSKIHHNKILNAGNSSTGAIAIDPGSNIDSGGNTEFNYTGTDVNNNIIWTSNSAHIDVVLQIGCRWMYQNNWVIANGGTIINNTSSGNVINANIFILIDGVINASVSNNNFVTSIEAFHSRPTGNMLMNSNSELASETNCPTCYELYDSSILNFWGHTGGVYIQGDSVASLYGIHAYSAKIIGDYPISSFNWQIVDYNNPANVLGSLTGATVYINFSKYYSTTTERFRLRLEVGPIAWKYNAPKEKYINNILIAKKSYDINGSIPSTYELKQNYPNPFNPTTKINYSLKEKGLVQLNVYNMLGQKVAELVNQRQEAGNHSITFNASGLSSGVYLYRIQSNEFSDSKKFILMK